MARLAGKLAVITGAGGGFGRAIARVFIREGAGLVLHDIHRPSLEKLSAEFGEYSQSVQLVQGDIACAAAVKKLFASITDPVAILVNNAGITRSLPLEKIAPADWDQVLEVNLKGAFLCSKEVIEQMKRRGSGKIINISSISGQTGRPVGVDYASSKAGLLGFTRNLAFQVAPLGINVNAVAPGPIITSLVKQLSPAVLKAIMESVPFKRQGTPEDVANAVLFLASSESDWITGETIAVNGGAFMG